MASRAISVKVATPKVIAALQSKLAEVKENYANQGKLQAEYDAAYKQYREDLTAYAIKYIDQATNFRTNVRGYNGQCVNIDYDVPVNLEGMPTEPERNHTIMYENDYKETVKEIENAIRILQMTDEETVSTSTFKTIAQYL